VHTWACAQVAVQQAGGAVLEQLLSWRRGAKAELVRERSESGRLRKQARTPRSPSRSALLHSAPRHPPAHLAAALP
jgi:hypothetical protein